MPIAPDKKFRAFDAALGRVVMSKRALRGMSRDTLSARSGIPLSNLVKSEGGKRSLSVAELEAIAEVVKVPAGEMAAEAVKEYGGIEKLMSEAAGTTDYETSKGDVDLAAHPRDAESDEPEDFD